MRLFFELPGEKTVEIRHTAYGVAHCMFVARYFATYGRIPSNVTVHRYMSEWRSKRRAKDHIAMRVCPYCTTMESLIPLPSNTKAKARLKACVDYLVDTGVIVTSYPMQGERAYGVQDAVSTAVILSRCVPGNPSRTGVADGDASLEGFEDLWQQ